MREVTLEELNELKKENKKILVQYHGDWCQPCKRLTPLLEELENENSNVEFLKFNIDQDRGYIVDLGIKSIPVVMLYKGENLISTINGVKPIDEYKKELEKI